MSSRPDWEEGRDDDAPRGPRGPASRPTAKPRPTLDELCPSGSTRALIRELGRRRKRSPEPENRRTRQPVRRCSGPQGHERAFVITKKQARLRVRALGEMAKRLKRAHPGKRAGAEGTISRIAEKVYDYLCGLAAEFKGKVFPTYERIAWEVGCTERSAVVAVSQLEHFGWLEHDRRYEETGERGIRGPKVRQISNWYRVKLPNAAGRLLAKWLKNSPPATDEGEETEADERQVLRDAGNRRDRERELCKTSPALAHALSRIGRKLGVDDGLAEDP